MYENQEKVRAKAINAALGKAGTGTVQIGIEFRYLDQPGGITYYGALTDAAFEYTMKAIRTAGWTGTDLSDLSSLCDGSAPEVMLVVEPEEFQGKTTRKVKFINSMGGLAMKDALQGNDLKAFAAKMKGKVLAYDQSSGSVKPTPRKPAPSNGPPPSDGPPPGFEPSDEIPF